MTFLWVVTGAALAVAVAAWITARRAIARLTQLSEMHWELKYQHLELRKDVDRLRQQRPAQPGADAPEPLPAAQPPPKESFVPLTSLRR
jgi:hypothetical protein